MSLDGVCAQIKVIGRVQGVFYRVFARESAKQLKLNGYASNEQDGSVKIVVCGPKEEVIKFVDLCKIGSEGSDVERVDFEFANLDEKFSDFEIRY